MKLWCTLDKVMEEKDLSTYDVAEKSGLMQSLIVEIKNNQRKSINRIHLGKIAKALDITDVSQLLTFKHEEDEKDAYTVNIKEGK